MKTIPTTLRLGLLAALIAVALLAGEGVGQERELHCYGEEGDNIYASYLNREGNIAICGQRGGLSEPHVWLMEVDLNGDVVMESLLDGITCATGLDIVEVDGGGYLIVGFSQEDRYAPYEFFAVRTDADGQVIWANSYDPPDNQFDCNRCYDVIELKNGDFVLAGTAWYFYDQMSIQKSWLMRINPDGDVVWSRLYYGNEEGLVHPVLGQSSIFSILESGDNILGGGEIWGRGGWLFSASQADGDIVWQHIIDLRRFHEGSQWAGHYGVFSKLLSSEGSYFAFGHGYNDVDHGDFDPSQYPLVKFNNNGEITSTINLNLMPNDRRDNSYAWKVEAARAIQSGGFVLTSFRHTYNANPALSHPVISRVDEVGQTIWEDTIRHVRINALQVVENDIYAFGRLGYRRAPANAFMYKVSDHTPPFFRRGGHNDEEDFNREDSRDREEKADGFAIRVLQGDVVRFWVDVHDRQNDGITYQWTLDQEVISDSTATTIAFDDLGLFDVVCRITDDEGETMDSLWWRVNVVELYIRSHQPPETSLRPARGEGVDFSLDVRAIAGRELSYQWVLDSALVSIDEVFFLDPLEDFGEKILRAIVSNGNAADSVIWTAQLRSLFRSWQPEGNELSVQVGSTVRFEVALEDRLPQGSLPYWIQAGDTLAFDTLAWEVTFEQVGQTWVEVAVMIDRELIENVVWTVNVTPLGVGGQDITPTQFGLFTVSPNPFNSTLTIRFSASPHAIAGGVSLAIYDLSGREVFSAVSPPRLTAPKGSSVTHGGATAERLVIWNASSVPAGVYLVRLQSGSDISTKKVVLMR